MSISKCTPFNPVPSSPFTPGTLYEQFANQSYTDTCKSRWESHNVDIIRKAAALRNDIAAMERTLARMEAEADIPYTAKDAEQDILAAGIPYRYVSTITRRASTRLEVQAGIDAYHAMKSYQYEKSAATLQRVIAAQGAR